MPTQEVFLTLVRMGLGLNTAKQDVFPAQVDWTVIKALADEQGLSAVVLDGIKELRAKNLELRVPQLLLLEWIGETEIQKMQYQLTWEVACKLGKMWAAEGIQATVLKGRAISQYYAVPCHRYSCDLDVFIENGWDRACEILESNGIQLEREVYKEVEFTLDDVYVECHRYITPVRGNKHLQVFERYLRALLHSEQTRLFEGTTLACPSLMFTVMLYIEHALGDFLHGHLSLKHIVDWVVLRRQDINRETLESRCKEFKFDRFLRLIESLADVVEGKIEFEALQPAYKDEFEEIFKVPEAKGSRSWFRRRVDLFFDIVKNGKKFREYGYTSMPSFLFHSMWTHFFDKEVKL